MVNEPTVPEHQQSGWLSSYEWKVSGWATGLVVLNIILMFIVSLTPLATVNAYLFSIPLVGVLIYGVLLTVGELYAERSLKAGNKSGALMGIGLLQLTYAAFGAGILVFLPEEYRLIALGITAVLTAGLTFIVSGYVYIRDTDFESWALYSTACFLGGVLFAGIGSLTAGVLIVAFGLMFLGFFFRLGYEVWQVREETHQADVAAIGVYVAVTGVFVHILQMVVRAMARQ